MVSALGWFAGGFLLGLMLGAWAAFQAMHRLPRTAAWLENAMHQEHPGDGEGDER